MSVKPLLIWGIAGAAALGLAIGFGLGLVSGRQDDEIKLNAEMLGAMQNLGSKTDQTFDDVANGVVDSEEQIYVKPDPPPPPFKIHIKSTLMVETNQERGLRVTVPIDNMTGKAIRAFDGKMIITDLLDTR